ncbi:MAG TPA: amidase family protein, partial [Roseiarcus sp.]
MTAAFLDGSAQAIAEAVRTGVVSAREISQDALNRIKARNGALGAFTDVTAARALAKASAIDAARARGESLGPLAGAPFAVKNLFDIQGLPTRAGSKINRDRPPATTDATVLARLEAAGGVLIGALNMGEYAYD